MTWLAAAMVVLVGLAGCRDDQSGDLAAFCDAVDALESASPFDGLDVASPDEMAAAFDDLRAGAQDIATAAPSDLRRRAQRYRDAVDAVRDELRAAAFDPRRVDTLRYREATADYQTAAVSLENAAADACRAPST